MLELPQADWSILWPFCQLQLEALCTDLLQLKRPVHGGMLDWVWVWVQVQSGRGKSRRGPEFGGLDKASKEAPRLLQPACKRRHMRGAGQLFRLKGTA